MNKGVLLRASIILGTFLIIILIAVGCEFLDQDAQEASITNPDAVYLTVDGVEITNQELWNIMKNVDGLDYLMDYVDEMLLADYISAVTQDEIDAEIRLLTYLTLDEDKIAEIQADEEVHQDYLDAFRQNVSILGYDPSDPVSLKEFVQVGIAKRALTTEKINTAVEDDLLYVKPEQFQEYYEAVTYGDACVLDVRFSSSAELALVFNEFNLVPNYEGGFGQYIGTPAIEDVAKDDFDDTNTEILTAEQVFSRYVLLYNFMNPNAVQLDTALTQEDYCANNADMAIRNQEDSTEYLVQGDPNLAYAGYIFDTLNLDKEDLVPYTYTNTQTFANYTMLTYKVSQEDITEWAMLDTAAQQVVKDELIETLLEDQVISNVMSELYEEAEFEIYDPYIGLKYTFQTGVEFTNDGSKTVVATFDGMEVTAQQLFDYMVGRVGTFYSIEAAKIKLVVESDEYVDMYGDSRDFMKNKSDEMIAHRDELRNMKSIFTSNGYASYGYSSNAMTWEEFIYLAFSVKTEAAVIESLFVVGNLQPGFINDTVTYEATTEFMQHQIDTYFSLNIDHILIYLDKDMDFTPDNFHDFIDGLDAAGLIEYNALKVGFYNLLNDKLNDDMTPAEIVTEFNETLINDLASDWAEYKAYGFFILAETLGNVDQTTVDNLDETFGDSLKRLYDFYVLDINVDEESIMDDQLTVSEFGIHLIEVSKGTDFEMKTAMFEYGDETEGSYSDGSVNANDLPSKAQVELYVAIKFAEKNDELSELLLPNSVYQAIEYYFGPIYEAYFSQTGYGIAVGNFMIAEDVVYANDNAATKAELQKIIDVFYEVNFPEYFDPTA